MTRRFALDEYPLPNGTLVEASAGTGKTYSVAALVTAAIATQSDLRIGEVLVTTFTRNAAAELRERIRGRLAATAARLRAGATDAADALDTRLLRADAGHRATYAARLERAVAEFDTAIVATIHGVCSRVLRAAGLQAADPGDEERVRRIVAETVNDELLAEAAAGRVWEESRLVPLVRLAAGDPFVVPWYDADGRQPDAVDQLEACRRLVVRCAERVRDRTRGTPSFDDLLRLAWEVLADPARDSLRTALRGRFKLAVIDEAQDTSRLQWEFFHLLFPPDGERPLVAVGDPKQAIYAFRGADVQSYLRFAQPAVGERERRTLDVNQRSDGPLLATLNTLLAGAEFGSGIPYQSVDAAPGRTTSDVEGVPPVAFVDIGPDGLVDVTVRVVLDILQTARLGEPRRPPSPGEVCVLVRTNSVGSAVAHRLARLGVRVVSTGTASVMHGQMGEDVRALLEALARPSSPGRVRRAAATVFFGHSLADVAALSEDQTRDVQERLATFAALVTSRGIAACGRAILDDAEIAMRLAAGPDGERHVADFAHLVELLHAASGGVGVPVRDLLDHVADLRARDATSELVSRRVESDEDAVQVMTIHAAKGLEFPCVVVADAWKRGARAPGPLVFYAGAERRLDLTHAMPDAAPSALAAEAAAAAAADELRRLLYVALTRARHHLSVLVDPAAEESILVEVMPALADLRTAPLPAGQARGVGDLAPLPDRWRAAAAAADGPPQLAPSPGRIRQRVRRTSFTGITAARRHVAADVVVAETPGSDEGEPPEAGVAPLVRMADLPAGTAVGVAVHEILQRVDTSCVDRGITLADEVRRLVAEVAPAGLLAAHHDTLTTLLVEGLQTPFGGPAAWAERCFSDFRPGDRLAEMEFEMAVPLADAGLLASDIGRLLAAELADEDPLRGYADVLAQPEFDVSLAGFVTGSIDAVLRLSAAADTRPRVLIADYKTNRLHARNASRPLDAYTQPRLRDAMAEHHYPLQALLYGAAIYRLVRWRTGDPDPGGAIAGIVYGFLRGMRGPETPVDAAGRRHGVFVWQPPAGLWSRLDRLLAGDRKGVRR